MSSQLGGPRLVGRIVDPSVGDGEIDPVFSPADDAPSSGPPAQGSQPPPSVGPAAGERLPVSEGPSAETRRVALPPLSGEVAPRSAGPASDRVLGDLATNVETFPYGSDDAEASDAEGLFGRPEPVGHDDLPDLPTARARGGAMRELLLAKVRETDPERARQLGDSVALGIDEIGRDFSPPTNPLERELDDIGQDDGFGRGAPSIVRTKAGVSPTWLAVFAAGFGVAIIACLVVVLVQIAPRRMPGEVPLVAVSSAAPEQGDAPPADEPVQPPKRVKLPGPWRVADDKSKPGMRIIQGEIGREPFLKAIQDAGLEKSQAYRALTALKDLRDLEKCNRTDRFIALVETGSKRLKGFEYEVSKEEVYQAKEDSAGLLRASKLDLKVDRGQVKGVMLLTGAGFDADAQRAGFETGLSEAVGKALRGQMSIGQFKKGDVLKVVAQEVTVLGEFARYAGVEALEYIPAGNPEKALQVYYFRGTRSKGYFDGKGRSPSDGGWRKPCPGAPITSRFNPNRMHPVLKKRMPHTGTDFGAPSGTPIHASSYGVVKFIGNGGPAGNLVMLSHDNDMETGYAHMSRFADGLKVGDRVERMQVIGFVGTTGRSTGPHLHFIAKRKGQFIDAETLHLDALRVLPSGERAEFEEFKKQYDVLLAELPIPAAPAEADSEAEAAPAEPEAGDDEGEEGSAALPESNVVLKPTGGAKPGAEKGVDLSQRSLHMSDEELLKAQPSTDDGEVN